MTSARGSAPSLLGIAAICVPALVWALAGIAPGFGREEKAAGSEPVESEPLWKDVRLLLIAGMLLAMDLAEGAATDLLPLLMVDDIDLSESAGSLVFAGFAATMTIGRFGGRFLLENYGRVAVLRGGGADVTGRRLRGDLRGQLVAGRTGCPLWGSAFRSPSRS